LEVLNFALPLCEVASGAARDAAVALILDVRAVDVPRVEALIDDLRPAVLTLLKARLAPQDGKSHSGLSVTGRKLPPIGSVARDGDGAHRTVPATPVGQEAQSRARATAFELGARGPPKRPTKAGAPSTIKAQPKLRMANDCESSACKVLSFENVSDDEDEVSKVLEDTK